MRLEIPGRPYALPRTTKRDKRNATPAYRAWRDEAGYRMRNQMQHQRGDRIPAGTLVIATLDVYDNRVVLDVTPAGGGHRPDNLKGDLDNYVKAVLDTANGIVYDDDIQVAAIRAQFSRDT